LFVSLFQEFAIKLDFVHSMFQTTFAEPYHPPTDDFVLYAKPTVVALLTISNYDVIAISHCFLF